MLGINLKYLPLKAHYFFFFGANASILPFVPSVAIQYGATPGIIGLIYASLPFFILVAKPTFGVLADKLQQKKLILMICLAVAAISLFCIKFIPSKATSGQKRDWGMWCDSQASQLILCYLPEAEVTKALQKTATASCNFACNLTALNPIAVQVCEQKPNLCPFPESKTGNLRTMSFTSVVNLGNVKRTTKCLMYPLQELKMGIESVSAPVCTESTRVPCAVQCDNDFPPPIPKASKPKGTINQQIVLMWILMIIGFAFMSSAIALADVIVIGLLPHIRLYGMQRLFGPLGYGILSLVVGKLVDAVSTPGQPLNFTPIYYVSMTLYVVDIVIVSRLDVRKAVKPENLFRHVCRLFTRAETFLFSSAVLTVGFFTGVLWTFLIVYAFELGATQFLIGMIYTVESFLGEIPFMFLSSWFLKKIGHGHAMTLVLAVFSLRFILYSLVRNPWMLLPIETTQGVCFGIFFTALATYSSLIAPPSTHATMQSIFQALFEGLGIGLGSLVGGIIYESVGSHTMWLTLGITLGALAVVHGLVLFAIQRARKAEKSGVEKIKDPSSDTDDADDDKPSETKDLKRPLSKGPTQDTSKTPKGST